MIESRAAARVGTKDDEATRQRKSDAALAARSKRTDHDTHTRPASNARTPGAWDRMRQERSDDFARWLDRMRGTAPPDQAVTEDVQGLDEHRALAERLGVRVVSRATLRRYGLTELEWLGMASRQGWLCPICQRRVQRFATDHEHVKGWGDMPPDDRKRYVRGLLCFYCNFRVVPSRMSAAEAYRMTDYLAAYEERRGS